MDKADAQLGGDQAAALGERHVVPFANIVDVRRHGCICADPVLLHKGKQVGFGQVRGRPCLVAPNPNALDWHLLPHCEVRNVDVVHLSRELNTRESWINDPAPTQRELLAVQVKPYPCLEELAVWADGREEVAGDHVIQAPAFTDLGLGASADRRNWRVITHVDTVTSPCQALSHHLLGILTPNWVLRLRTNCSLEVKVGRVSVRLGARISQPATQVQVLCDVHGLLWPNAQPCTCHLEHGHCVEGLRAR
mmetsp:Transcript_23282/g.66211  ORF Transcript_23282/g.66211 Transcript_23282/m.66211 type:complete len:250 (-) Transcript_23282:924-1673(-)